MNFQLLVERAREHSARRPVSAGRRLATGQQPTALFVTCADSRVVPSQITGADAGNLFELRTAVSALHGAEIGHLPAMRNWLTAHGSPETPARQPDPALREEGRRHVTAQLDTLLEYPFVRDRVGRGELRVHGWFYDIETGVVHTAPEFQPL